MKLTFIMLIFNISLSFCVFAQTHEMKTINKDATLRENDSPVSNILHTIPAGTKVEIISKEGNYYQIEYKGQIGFVNEMYFESNTISNNVLPSNISKDISNQQFNPNCNEIKFIPGRNFPSKPSINVRLASCDRIFVPIPNQNTFVWGLFVDYLRNLGLNVIEVPQNFKQENSNFGSVYGLYTAFEGNPFTFVKEVNDLLVVINHLAATSTYTGTKQSARISFVDLFNSYNWDFGIDIPNSEGKYREILKKTITSSIVRNPSIGVIAPKKLTCWNEIKIKEDFLTNGSDLIEGIYEESSNSNKIVTKYKLALKKTSNTYYLIYLSDNSNSPSWQEGELKATLEYTSTPGFFKAKWLMYDKKENTNFYVSFEDGLMTVIDPDKVQNIYVKMFPTNVDNINPSSNISISGTGFALTSNGLIVTNNHVIDGAKTIRVRGINGDFSRTFSANLVTTDKNNDLAIIKIDDSNFTNFSTIPYIIKSSGSSVGENVFVLGYPLRATMGDEIKLTNGIISSKTGFQGDVTSYQISAPVQPGNSGGPLFDSQGNLIGIINAKHTGAENASYAVKVSYLTNLIDLLEKAPSLPQYSSLNGKALPEQVSLVKRFVYIIESN